MIICGDNVYTLCRPYTATKIFGKSIQSYFCCCAGVYTMSAHVIGTLDDGEKKIEFVLYKPEYFDGFNDVLWNGYLANECLALGLGMNLPGQHQALEEISRICIDSLNDGLAILARDARTGRIVGHVINKLIVQDTTGAPSYFESYMNNECKMATSKEYIRYILELDARVDMFAIHKTDVLLEVMFLGVHPEYTRRSIGLKLVEFSLQLGRDLKAGKHLDRLPEGLRSAARRLGGATALYASNYSKAIGEKLGFVLHDEMFYDRMEFDGKVLQDRIPNAKQRSMKLMSVPII